MHWLTWLRSRSRTTGRDRADVLTGAGTGPVAAGPDPWSQLPALDQRLVSLTRELDGPRQQLVLGRLRLLQRRQVPLRVLRAAPVAGTARLGFADGTVLLVRVRARADVLAVALFTRGRSVRVSRCWCGDDGPTAELAWPGRRLPVVVVGTDQPD